MYAIPTKISQIGSPAQTAYLASYRSVKSGLKINYQSTVWTNITFPEFISLETVLVKVNHDFKLR